MERQQLSQPKEIENVCVEVAREIVPLIGNVGNVVSGRLSAFFNYSVAVFTVAVLVAVIYLEILKFMNIIEHHPFMYPILVSICLFVVLILVDIYVRTDLELARAIRDDLITMLCCRKAVLHACQEILCKESHQRQYCIDINIALESIKRMESLLKKDCSKLCEMGGKTALSTLLIDLKRTENTGG